MNWDDIKEQLTEQFQVYQSKFLESSAFIQVKEKYENLTPRQQKWIQKSLLTLFVLWILYVPFGYFFSSVTSIQKINENKRLMNELTAISQLETGGEAPPAPELNNMTTVVRSHISDERILEKQIAEIRPLNPNETITSLPKFVEQMGVYVLLSQLNLRQIVSVTHRVDKIFPTARVFNMKILPNKENPQYSDLSLSLVFFKLRQTGPEGGPVGAGGGRSGGSNIKAPGGRQDNNSGDNPAAGGNRGAPSTSQRGNRGGGGANPSGGERSDPGGRTYNPSRQYLEDDLGPNPPDLDEEN